MPPGLQGPGRATGGAGWLSRILAALATCALLVVGVMFSLAILAVGAVVGAMVLVWIWWKLRRVRESLRQARFHDNPAPSEQPGNSPSGSVIDGEILKGEWKDDSR